MPKFARICKGEPHYKDPSKTTWVNAGEIVIFDKEDGTQVPDTTLETLFKLMAVNICGNRCKVFLNKPRAAAGAGDDIPI